MQERALRLGFWPLLLLIPVVLGGAGRQVPRPLLGHPGNVFLAGEPVEISLPNDAADWQVVDYDGRVVVSDHSAKPRLSLGQLPVGWYEARWGPEADWTSNRMSVGVLAPWRQAPSPSSPVALDVAMAWFYPPEQMPPVANLCALAGVNWVRDRLNWAELEPRRGQFGATNRYDASARAQAAAGLRQLQVNHLSPAWANPRTARFPLDLRDAYGFYRNIALRWRGPIEAFEPWNEADIPDFGGHTGSEIASLQKAAWLGLKAGNPKVIACQNVFALSRRPILEDFHENGAWPYFDTFNLHHYVKFDAYPGVYADFRVVSAGRPLWVTECNLPVHWSGDDQLKEPSAPDLRIQAERVACVFATALHEGAAEVFYFLFPHFVEGQTQFGIVRPDLTPRPAYLALAAVGRLLAEARPAGLATGLTGQTHAYAFHARPDGRERDVLVAWSAPSPGTLLLPAVPETVLDHLGRLLPAATRELKLTAAPVFAIFKPGLADQLALTPPPKPAVWLPGKPSPVVLQARVPVERLVQNLSAYRFEPVKPATIPIHVYNFGARAVRGRLKVSAPPAWPVEFPSDLSLPPQGQRELSLVLGIGQPSGTNTLERVLIEGDFGAAGQAVLSFRLQVRAAE